MKNGKVYRMVLAALWLCVGMVLPLLTMQVKEVGDSLLPMHLAVMLCGLTCGRWYGAAVGMLLPFFRSLIFGMPPIYPNAVWMAFELAAYGFMIGFIYSRFKTKNIGALYVSLVSSMIFGRIVWGIAKSILLGIEGNAFTVKAFFVGGVVDALPGIVLQLILIPVFMKLYDMWRRKKV